MKKIVSLLLVITLVLTLGGCFGEETEKVTPEDVKNRVISEAKEYLKETYPDDEFTYISGRSPNWAYNYYEIGFSSKNYDNQEVVVFGTSTDEIVDGKTVYSYYDNYFQYYMKEEAENYFYDTAKEYINDDVVIKVNFLTNIAATKKINNNKSFKDNLQNDNFRCLVYVFSDKKLSQTSTSVEEFLQQIANDDITIKLYYIYTDQLSTISNCKTNAIFEHIEDYSIDKDTGAKYSTYDSTVEKYEN